MLPSKSETKGGKQEKEDVGHRTWKTQFRRKARVTLRKMMASVYQVSRVMSPYWTGQKAPGVTHSRK